MANTTWNPSDKTASVTLSGSNLTATLTASGGGVRTIDRQISGSYYFEYTCSTFTSQGVAGVGTAAAVLATINATSTNAAVVLASSGNIIINGSASGSTLGARASGDIIAVAVDVANALIWFRVAPAGNWNGSGTANPATATGGLSIRSFVPPAFALYGVFGSNTVAVVTANFGDTAFSGSAPAGFTSGFPTGTPPTNALATQAAVEHWLTTAVPAQVTQIALEHWVSVGSTGIQAVITQAALEHWASVAVVPFTVNGPMITMIGAP